MKTLYFCALVYKHIEYADVAKLAYAPDLGSGGATRGSSTLPIRTMYSGQSGILK